MSQLNKKLQKMDANEVAQLYKKTFDSPEAKLLLEDLKNRCFIKTTPLGVNDSHTNFNIGMQSVVLHIENQINQEPDENPEQEGE